MSDILLDNQAAPAAPASGKSIIMVDATTKKLAQLDEAGVLRGLLSRNAALASQGAGFAADTYVTNSGLLVPSSGILAGMRLRWVLTASKTAAGVAGAVYTIRLGTAQSVADAALLALTGGAQTAVADNGVLIVTATVRSVSAAGVIAGAAAWAKTQAGTAGLGGSIDGVSAGVDLTAAAGKFFGLSINGGAAAAWTVTSVDAELVS